MRSGRLLLLVMVALSAACPPPWEELPFPAGEGEGEGEGDCVGQRWQSSVSSFALGSDDIMDMVAGEAGQLNVALFDGTVLAIDLEEESTSPIGECPSIRHLGQLSRTASNLLVRTGRNGVCIVTPMGVSLEFPLVTDAGAENPVGGAVLVDGDPTLIVLAHQGSGGNGLVVLVAPLASDGQLGTPESFTFEEAAAEALVTRVGNSDRALVTTMNGDLIEVWHDGVASHAELRQRVSDVGRYGYVALGSSVAGVAPMVMAVNGTSSELRVLTGSWEDGVGFTGTSQAEALPGFLSGFDQAQGALFASRERAVVFGDYGLLAELEGPSGALTPVSLGFRAGDVIRMAISDQALWAITGSGGVAHWADAAPLCDGQLPSPTHLMDVLSGGAELTGALAPFTGESRALVGTYVGASLVDFDSGEAPLRHFIFGGPTNAIVLDQTSNQALLVGADGGMIVLDVGTMTLESTTAIPLVADDRSDLAVGIDEAATTAAGVHVFWIAGHDGAASVLLRCSWDPSADPTCSGSVPLPAGPANLGGEPERYGAVRVLGDHLVVLMASGARLFHLSGGDEHQVADLALVNADLNPLEGMPEYFGSLDAADAVQTAPGCALLTGFGYAALALDLATPDVEVAHNDSRDPYQTAVAPICPGKLLVAGGEGDTFSLIDLGPSCGPGLASNRTLLGPARPRLQLRAGAAVDDEVWVAEGDRLWRLPDCPPQ